jgi:hypothetical protein
MNYKLHMAYANREDLAVEAVGSVLDIGNIILWPNGDNADQLGNIAGVRSVRRMPPMAPVSLINLMIHDSWHDDVMFWMHNDALALPGVANRMLQRVRELHASDKKWGVLFTHYDVLCAFNMKCVREIGYWDPMFFQYVADVEYYHRMRKAGWTTEEFGPGVVHRVGPYKPGDPENDGSVTVRSDPLFAHRTAFRGQTQFDNQYYELKWGGFPGREKYDRPFGNTIR